MTQQTNLVQFPSINQVPQNIIQNNINLQPTQTPRRRGRPKKPIDYSIHEEYTNIIDKINSVTSEDIAFIKQNITNKVSEFTLKKQKAFAAIHYAFFMINGGSNSSICCEMNAGNGVYHTIPGSPYNYQILAQKASIKNKNTILFEKDPFNHDHLKNALSSFNQSNILYKYDHNELFNRTFLRTYGHLFDNIPGILLSDHDGYPPVESIKNFYTRTTLNLFNLDFVATLWNGAFLRQRGIAPGKQGNSYGKPQHEADHLVNNLLDMNKQHIIISRSMGRMNGWRILLATNNKNYAELVRTLLRTYDFVYAKDSDVLRDIFLNSKERTTNTVRFFLDR